MSVLFGLYQPEEGIIKKDGKVVSIKDPLEPCYLMGYYDQRNDLYTSKKDKQEEDK